MELGSSAKKFPDSQAGHRVAQVGRDFTKRFEHEPPLAKPRMGYCEPRLFHNLLPYENQIEIERPRSVRVRSGSPGVRLDRVQRVEQFAGR